MSNAYRGGFNCVAGSNPDAREAADMFHHPA